MAKFLCVCGESIRTSGFVPNPGEWRFLSDEEFDALGPDIDGETVYRTSRPFYRCPASGHLWVFWHGFDAPPQGFSPIEPGVEVEGG